MSAPEIEIYAVGYNYYHQCGLSEAGPVDVPTFAQVTWPPLDGAPGDDPGAPVDVAAGDAHTVILTSTGRVYTCGDGRAGQLGHGDRNVVSSPRLVAALKDHVVTRIACGAQSTVALTTEGLLYQWGCLQPYGENFTPKPICAVPTVVRALARERVVQVACGGYHVAAVTSTGALYAFGHGQHAQLGMGDHTSYAAPKHVKALSGIRIKSVACGRSHTIALAHDGALYGWGRNLSGALPIQSPNAVEELPRVLPSLLPPPTAYPDPAEEASDVRIDTIACGAAHTMLTMSFQKPDSTDDGATRGRIVCGSGWNSDGQMGVGTVAEVPVLVRMKPLIVSDCAEYCIADREILQVACGRFHTAVVTRGGALFMCGCGSDYRTGHPVIQDSEDSTMMVATEVPGLRAKGLRVLRVACGSAHTVILATRK